MSDIIALFSGASGKKLLSEMLDTMRVQFHSIANFHKNRIDCAEAEQFLAVDDRTRETLRDRYKDVLESFVMVYHKLVLKV